MRGLPGPNLELTFSDLLLLYSGAGLDITEKSGMMSTISPKFYPRNVLAFGCDQ